MSLPATMPESRPAEATALGLSAEDWAALTGAVEALERESLAGALNRILGRRMKAVTSLAPKSVSETVSHAVDLALKGAMRAAIKSLPPDSRVADAGQGRAGTSIYGHRAAVALSGAAGGAFGLALLPLELPISTTLMLRAIAEIARAEGEDLSQPAAALACVEVFALGSPGDEGWEAGYFGVRAVLAKAVGAATVYAAGRGLAEETAPALMRYVSLIATRFGAAVTQKLSAQAVPLLGAAGGAAVNYVFMEHFQRLAKAHFTVRRLERAYGSDRIRDAYEQIRLARAGDRARPVDSAQAPARPVDSVGSQEARFE